MSAILSLGRVALAAARPFVSLLAELADILAGAVLVSGLVKKRGLDSNGIYSTAEVANRLGMGRVDVIREIRSGALKARMVGGNYRITGQNVIAFMDGAGSDNPTIRPDGNGNGTA